MLGRNIKYTNEELKKLLEETYTNNTLEILEYSGMNHPMKVKCKKCGWEHTYTRGIHLFRGNKIGCPSCHGPNKPRLTKEIAQQRIDDVFGKGEYEILRFEKESSPLLVRHNRCGFCFSKTRLYNMTKSLGCPKCKSQASKGEMDIAKLLKKWHIPYQTEYIFQDLWGKSTKGRLRFDFAILGGPQLLLIEFDGPQHFEPGHYKGDFEQQILNDQKKDEYCQIHQYPLLRIPYWDSKKIPTLLKEFLILNDYPLGEQLSSESETLDTRKSEDIVSSHMKI